LSFNDENGCDHGHDHDRIRDHCGHHHGDDDARVSPMLSLVLLILPIHDDDDCIFRVNGHDRDLCGHGYYLNDDHECETVSCSSFLIFFYVHSCGDA